MVATLYHEKDIVRVLLQHPCIDVNAKFKDGYTALMKATAIGDHEIVQLLLAHPNIDVNAQNKYKFTALMSSYYDRVEPIRLLLQHPDIDVNLKNDKQETCLNIAARSGNIDILLCILRHPKLIIDHTDVDIWEDLTMTIKQNATWWRKCLSYCRSLFYLRQAITRRYPSLRDPMVRDVLQTELYRVSKPCFLPLYRYLERHLNKDMVNIVFQYVFTDCGGNMLSENDLDIFLRYELDIS